MTGVFEGESPDEVCGSELRQRPGAFSSQSAGSNGHNGAGTPGRSIKHGTFSFRDVKRRWQPATGDRGGIDTSGAGAGSDPRRVREPAESLHGPWVSVRCTGKGPASVSHGVV